VFERRDEVEGRGGTGPGEGRAGGRLRLLQGKKLGGWVERYLAPERCWRLGVVGGGSASLGVCCL
jgi:hypothetical protein